MKFVDERFVKFDKGYKGKLMYFDLEFVIFGVGKVLGMLFMGIDFDMDYIYIEVFILIFFMFF